MRPLALVLIALLSFAAGCCSLQYEDIRERAQRAENRVKEMESFIAGCQDDNAMLQKDGILRERELGAWQYGAHEQAKRIAQGIRACEM